MRQHLSVIQEAGVTIVHEAEAQRQHVRLRMPVYVELGGRVLSTRDWSVGGVALQWAEGSEPESDAPAIGKNLEGHMIFTFDGFDMTMPVQLEIRYLSRQNGRIGCRFASLDPRQASLLQFFTGAYVAGEIVRAGDILDVVNRNNFTAGRKEAEEEAARLSPAERLRRDAKRYAGAGAIVLLSLALLAYVAASVYEKVFVVTASSAAVAADMVAVEAPTAGKVFFQPQPVDSEVRVGEPLLMVSTENGSMISVDSPCNCLIKDRLADSQEWVRAGQRLLKLAPMDTDPYVLAFIRFEDALRVAPGQEAMIGMRGVEGYLRGVVTGIRADTAAGAGAAALTITPEEALPVALVDDPVEVKIDTFGDDR